MRYFILLLFALATPALAHDGYEKWTSNEGVDCCNNYDCKPIDDELVRTTAKGYEIQIAGQWCPVIPEKHYLSKGNAPDHSSFHACIRRRYTGGVEDPCYFLICFQPKSGF